MVPSVVKKHPAQQVFPPPSSTKSVLISFYLYTKHGHHNMEIGIDSFAAAHFSGSASDPNKNMQAMANLLERVQRADQVGLDIFGIGEHHRKEFLDSITVHYQPVI